MAHQTRPLDSAGRPPACWTRGALLVALGVPWAAPLAAQELQVDLEQPRLVRFISQTTLEEFDGHTENIDGFVLLPGGLSPGEGHPGSQLYLEVDLASIETGIGLRDRHMRENYLETDRYPWATYSAEIISVESAPGDSYSVLARGRLGIHGVEREGEIQCTVRSTSPPHRVSCDFPVLLGDHAIEIPRLMFLKLAEEVQLQVEFTLRPAAAG
jgi:polyisoprenoid-binding protein YceI